MVRATIGLGANLGEPMATLEAACAALAGLPQTHWLQRSPWYRSAPVDATGPDFVNAAVALETELAPLALLDALQAIELTHGRKRPYRNAPRTLDLDLLLYGDCHLQTDRLTLPHPRVTERAFVLLPLLDLQPDLVWPGIADLPALAQRLAREQGIERLPG